MYESQFGGITMQAVTLTFATMFGLLFAYKTGIIKPDKNFMLMVFAGTFAIFALYLVNFIMMFSVPQLALFTITDFLVLDFLY